MAAPRESRGSVSCDGTLAAEALDEILAEEDSILRLAAEIPQRVCESGDL
jgi:hypothetical protein